MGFSRQEYWSGLPFPSPGDLPKTQGFKLGLLHCRWTLSSELVLYYSTLKSTVVQYSNWHTGAGIEWTDKKSYWLEKQKEVGDGKAQGSLATGDRGQAAISLMFDIDSTGSGSLLSSVLLTWKIIQGSLASSSCFFFFFYHKWHSITGLHSERLLHPLCTILYLGPVPQKLTVPPQIPKIPLPFSVLCISLVHLNSCTEEQS